MHKISIFNINKRFYPIVRIRRVIDKVRYTSTNDQGRENIPCKDSKKEVVRPIYTPENPVSIDDPPTTCCMSGCANCVYLAWAEALSKQMASADPKIATKILSNVTDPSMRAFLQMELRNLGIIK